MVHYFSEKKGIVTLRTWSGCTMYFDHVKDDLAEEFQKFSIWKVLGYISCVYGKVASSLGMYTYTRLEYFGVKAY